MLADPQSVTVSGVTTSLPRVRVNNNEATYSDPESTLQLRARHQIGRRTRREIRLDLKKVSADVFLPSQNVQQSMSVIVVFDMPAAGYTAAEALAAYAGLNTQLTASSNAVLTAFLGGQS